MASAQPDQWPAVHEVEPQIGEVTQKPEVVDDFIRNFLVKMGLSKTLEMFETEWWLSTLANITRTTLMIISAQLHHILFRSLHTTCKVAAHPKQKLLAQSVFVLCIFLRATDK